MTIWAQTQRSPDELKLLKKGDLWQKEIRKLDSTVVDLERHNNSLNRELIDLKTKNNNLKNENNKLSESKKEVNIGGVVWSKENLKVKTLNDSTALFCAQSRADWDRCYLEKIPAYCIHPKDSSGDFGYLYNIHALKSPKLSPNGWGIPTENAIEKTILAFGNQKENIGQFLKSKDSSDWHKPGLDLFDLNIRPLGLRNSDLSEWYFNDKIYLYIETNGMESITFRQLNDYSDKLSLIKRNIDLINTNTNYGVYVRCVKIN